MKTTEFVQSIRKMAFGIDKVTCFGEGIIYRIWVPKNQHDSVKVAMIWQDKNRKIIDPEGYRAIKDYLSALEESDLLGIISDYMATPIDERGLPDSGGRRMSLTDGRYLSFNHGPKFTTIYGDQFTTSDPH